MQLQRASGWGVDLCRSAQRPHPAVYARSAVTDSPWFYWALLSAVFAALTAIFAKLGLQGVAKTLGMTSQQLHDDLSSGKSLAEASVFGVPPTIMAGDVAPVVRATR